MPKITLAQQTLNFGFDLHCMSIFRHCNGFQEQTNIQGDLFHWYPPKQFKCHQVQNSGPFSSHWKRNRQLVGSFQFIYLHFSYAQYYDWLHWIIYLFYYRLLRSDDGRGSIEFLNKSHDRQNVCHKVTGWQFHEKTKCTFLRHNFLARQIHSWRTPQMSAHSWRGLFWLIPWINLLQVSSLHSLTEWLKQITLVLDYTNTTTR